jgi:hypothetical protein
MTTSQSIIGTPITAIHNKYNNTKALPPFSAITKGNFHILPRPTVPAVAAIKNSQRLDHTGWTIVLLLIDHPPEKRYKFAPIVQRYSAIDNIYFFFKTVCSTRQSTS